MQLKFSALDIESWASLSGDRNPIHFSREAALRMDVADVVVHGMLVLLPIKHQMGRISVAFPHTWTQFKALLKTPVLRDTTAALSTADRNGCIHFKLLPEIGGSEHMIGNIRTVPASTWSPTATGFELQADKVELWLEQFHQGLGRGLDDWIALDALIFSDFIRNYIDVGFNYLTPEFRLEQRLKKLEDLSTHLVVQTSHQTTFCSSLRSFGELGANIRYEIDNINMIEGPDKAVGTLDLGVYVRNFHVMTITIGLMVKKI